MLIMIFFDIDSTVSFFVVKYHKTRYDTHKLHRKKDECHEKGRQRQRAGVAFALLVLTS
jgi:hypothetical protein